MKYKFQIVVKMNVPKSVRFLFGSWFIRDYCYNENIL